MSQSRFACRWSLVRWSAVRLLVLPLLIGGLVSIDVGCRGVADEALDPIERNVRELQSAVGAHLEEKYGEPFSVTEIDLQWEPVKFRAHPEGRPAEAFDGSIHRRGNGTSGVRRQVEVRLVELDRPHSFSDRYVCTKAIGDMERRIAEAVLPSGHRVGSAHVMCSSKAPKTLSGRSLRPEHGEFLPVSLTWEVFSDEPVPSAVRAGAVELEKFKASLGLTDVDATFIVYPAEVEPSARAYAEATIGISGDGFWLRGTAETEQDLEVVYSGRFRKVEAELARSILRVVPSGARFEIRVLPPDGRFSHWTNTLEDLPPEARAQLRLLVRVAVQDGVDSARVLSNVVGVVDDWVWSVDVITYRAVTPELLSHPERFIRKHYAGRLLNGGEVQTSETFALGPGRSAYVAE